MLLAKGVLPEQAESIFVHYMELAVFSLLQKGKFKFPNNAELLITKKKLDIEKNIKVLKGITANKNFNLFERDLNYQYGVVLNHSEIKKNSFALMMSPGLKKRILTSVSNGKKYE